MKKLLRPLLGLIAALALLSAVRPAFFAQALTGQALRLSAPATPTRAPALAQATRTPRPTVLRPTRRPTRTATVTAPPSSTPFRPDPPTATIFPSITALRVDIVLPSATNPPPAAPTLPAAARIEGLTGYGQSLPLSCESRSAVDWARYFGVEIGELEFFNRVPFSADPELGFVGSPYGAWGQIPPDAYGVHAEPVAQALRGYGLPARAVRNFSLTAALAEIAAGRPVVLWVTGHVEPGRGVDVVIDGQTRRVARYEHTVILIGYNDDSDILTFQDGARVYERPIPMFLQAWEPLEYMAVIFQPNE